MHNHNHPINCIVPPHMLEDIATKGSKTQRELAINTLKASEQMRGQRRALSDFTGAVSRFAAVGDKERIIYDAKNGTSLPGTSVRNEGDGPTSDVTVDEAYDGSGATYDELCFLVNNAHIFDKRYDFYRYPQFGVCPFYGFQITVPGLMNDFQTESFFWKLACQVFDQMFR